MKKIPRTKLFPKLEDDFDAESVVINAKLLHSYLDELERTLELSDHHPYDGIECRDETIQLQQELLDRATRKIQNLEEVVRSYEEDNGRSYDPSRLWF